ncbi:DUF2637 domain-containing protein [Actinoallomurus sp. NPDC052274]|uniref:DUF2637 domain-containing protein n=1 Tax=Actinoallomurus sp. NPDC052274 TaxID=3155420 RepID=UPI00341A9727
MSWDVRSERITARAQAAKDQAEAEAIRAQAAAARAQADDERAARAEQRKTERRTERRKRWADQRAAVAGRIRRYAVPVAAIGSPEVIAWAGQYGFGSEKMHLGVLAPLLPVALEGGVLYSATLALEAVDAGKPAGKYRAATWVQAAIAAALNYWHGSKDGADVGVALALTSLLGIVMLELTIALRRHKASGRSSAEIRTGLVRRIRYPRLSMAAASIAAARGLDVEAAWRAAWVDRYGIGPDSTRRDRQTARVILARQQRADRKAAKAGHLAIVDGAIVRPAPEPTEAERQAEAFAVLFGLDLSDEALADWLNDPPDDAVTSATEPPDTGGPQGGSSAAKRPGQISGDQGERETPGDGDRAKAADVRRARGEQTRARIADYIAKHPKATVEQIAKALDMSTATVKRHRRAIQSGE